MMYGLLVGLLLSFQELVAFFCPESPVSAGLKDFLKPSHSTLDIHNTLFHLVSTVIGL